MVLNRNGMRYSKYLMEEKVINLDGIPPAVGIIVAPVGLFFLASIYPLAYTIDKTNDLWQKVTR